MILKTSLYQHQIKAVEKLQHIKVGALYMEMGTGKTRTALELINLRLDAGKVDHVLWLCPCSVKESLRRDLLKHTDDISSITICGIETLSSSIKTNFELLDMVKNNNVYLIVDESNLVKNHEALRTQNIIRLAESCKYKLILNGTPISRSEKDLYAQWYILDWRILGYQSFWSFAANHLEYDDTIPGKINRCLNVPYLVKKIAPYTYQVKKSECLDLPDKTYYTEYYDMTDEQDEHYQYIADVMLNQIDEFKPETIYRLFSALQNVIGGFLVTPGKHLTKEIFFRNPLDNPRIQCLLRMIYTEETEKTIIFCKYTYEIETITKLLNDKYGPGAAVPFYGELNQKKRQKNLDLFSTTAQFLVANKVCAGYGLNLQFCSYVIYYNNDWDYATRSQSEDRVHRIGQNKNVHIVDICAANTLDERILKCLDRKENLVDSFKNEIEKQKDDKFIDTFIYRKDTSGRRYTEESGIKDLECLKEDVSMKIYEGNYDKAEFYSAMGEFFAERHYKKLMPYLVNDENTIWHVITKDNKIKGFVSLIEKSTKVNLGYCFAHGNISTEINLLERVVEKYKEKDIYIELEKNFNKQIYIDLGFETYKDTTNYWFLRRMKNSENLS